MTRRISLSHRADDDRGHRASPWPLADIEARGLGGFEERAVLELVPVALERRFNGVSTERPPQRSRRSLIKQEFQESGWDSQALACVLQYRIDLRARNARKPVEEIHDRGTAFEILEEGADGNAGAAWLDSAIKQAEATAE